MSAFRMPFGKHKGCRMDQLPDGYLEWLYNLDDLRPSVREAVEVEWKRRYEPEVRPKTLPKDVAVAADQIVTAGYRSLAIKNHPDHGGSVETMQQINRAVEILRKLIR